MRKILIYTFLVSLFILASIASISIDAGDVWADHISAGLKLLAGLTPTPSTYPMWGYSFFAALFGKWTILVQGIIAYLAFMYWQKNIRIPRLKTNPLARSKLLNLICWIPTFSLMATLYSNSMSVALFTTSFLILANGFQKERIQFVPFIYFGFFSGLAFNFRSEYLLYFIGIAAFLFIYALKKKDKILTGGVFISCLVFLITLLPWAIYTNSTLGTPTLSSSNGPAVMYLGLGNIKTPEGIVPSDKYVTKIALENGLSSPWSYEASLFFSKKIQDFFKSNPSLVLKRALIGIKLMLFQGVQLPDFRNSFSNSTEIRQVDFINEQIKAMLGLATNIEELDEYRKDPILNSQSLNFLSLARVFIDYSLRFFFEIGFLLILAIYLKSLLHSKTWNHPITYMTFPILVSTLLIAALIQSIPRHTTLLLPILFTNLLIVNNANLKSRKG